MLHEGLKELKIRKKIDSVYTAAMLASAGILKKLLQIKRDLSLDSQRNAETRAMI